MVRFKSMKTKQSKLTFINAFAFFKKFFGLSLIAFVFAGCLTQKENQEDGDKKVTSVTEKVAAIISNVSPIEGPLGGGTLITVTGSNFISETLVLVGDKACSGIKIVNASKLTCKTPAASAGVVSVSVYNSVDKKSTKVSAYTYASIPTITSISPNGGALAGGTVLTITGLGFESNATIKVGTKDCAAPQTINATEISCTISTSGGNHAAGFAPVVVTNNPSVDAKSATLTNAYKYSAAPSIISVHTVTTNTDFPAASAGSVNGNTLIEVYGSNFMSNPLPKVHVGTGLCSNVAFLDTAKTRLRCRTPARSSVGTVSVRVENSDNQLSNSASYDYFQAPTVATVVTDSTDGKLAGGDTITITGTNFRNFLKVYVGNVVCSSSTYNSPTSATCVTPSRSSAGTVAVKVVNNDYQEALLSSSYTYNPSPIINFVTPNFGAASGQVALDIFIYGSNFNTDVVVKFDGVTYCDSSSHPTNWLSNLSAGFIKCSLPNLLAGARTLSVVNPDLQSASTTFTLYGPPTVSSISPNFGRDDGGTSVTILGNAIRNGASVQIGGKTCKNPVVTQLTAPAASVSCTTDSLAAGAAHVVVRNADGQTAQLTNGFTFTADPIISSFTPAIGRLASNATVTITGLNFLSGATVKFGSSTCSSPNVTVNADPTPDTITCIPPDVSAATSVRIVVSNPDGQIAQSATTYEYLGPPTITSVTPATTPLTLSALPSSSSYGVVVSGTNFRSTPALPTVMLGVNTCLTVSVVNSTTINCTSNGNTAQGSDYSVSVSATVTNADGQSGTKTDAIKFNQTPVLDTISRDKGPLAGGGSPITLTGEYFISSPLVQKTKVYVDGIQVDASKVVVSSDTSLTYETPAHIAGSVDVVVKNFDGQISNDLNYDYLPAPTISSLSVNACPVSSAACSLTVQGTNFVGSTVKIGLNTCSSPIVSSTSISCNVPLSASAGSFDVVVTNTDGQIATLVAGYTYLPAPTLDLAEPILPIIGSTLGGTAVTLKGTNFFSGMKVFLHSVDTVDNTYLCDNGNLASSTQYTCTTKDHIAGAVHVKILNVSGQTVTKNNAFTFAAPPVISSISKVDGNPLIGGNVSGGTTVRVNGSNFVAGATGTTIVKLMTNILDSSAATCTVSAVTATTITCVTTSYPTAQSVKVYVKNPNGIEAISATNLFIYSHKPAITAMSQYKGLPAVTTDLTITGTNFNTTLTPTSVTIGGMVCTSVNVPNTNTITCTAPAQAASATPKDVLVINPDGQQSDIVPNSTFTYQPDPILVSVTSPAPAKGSYYGGTSITLSGSGLDEVTSVTVGDTLTSNTPCVIQSGKTATNLTCITGNHAIAGGLTGLVDIKVTNSLGRASNILTDAFEYTVIPTISGLSPTFGSVNGSNQLTISGSGFIDGTDPGPRLSVTIGGNVCTSPTLSGVSPAAQTITCTVPAAPGAPPAVGTQNVIVTNVGGTTNSPAAVYNYVSNVTLEANPIIHASTSIPVTGGALLGGQTVVIKGSGFLPNAVVTFTKGSLSGTCSQVGAGLGLINQNTIKCTTPKLGSSGSAGLATIRVTNVNGQYAENSSPGFTYRLAPSLAHVIFSTAADTSVDPAGGPVAGGTVVKVIGTNFLVGKPMTVHFISGGVENSCDTLTVNSSTKITCTSPISPISGGGPGKVTVKVTSDEDGQFGTKANAFKYNLAPTISGVTVTGVTNASGPVTGGTSINISGTNFLPADTTYKTAKPNVNLGPVPCNNVTVNTAGTLITCTTSAHTAGLVGVTVANYDLQSATSSNAFRYNPVMTITGIDETGGLRTGNQLVTIRGTNFSSTQNVVESINFSTSPSLANACTSAVISDTVITCLTPSFSTIGDRKVTLRTPDKQVVTSPDSYDFKNMAILAWDGNPSSPVTLPQVVSGELYTEKILTLKNNGNISANGVNVTLSNITTAPYDTPPFMTWYLDTNFSNCNGVTVPAGGSCSVKVIFVDTAGFFAINVNPASSNATLPLPVVLEIDGN
jgi:hypothetical protein